jgi:beta-lactamase regulating signal transducer with metallopeptidase domain
MRADREFSCDLETLKFSGSKNGLVYGQTLINLLQSFPENSIPLGGAVSFFETMNRNKIKRRIKLIAEYSNVKKKDLIK